MPVSNFDPLIESLKRNLLLWVTRDHLICQCQVLSTSKITSIITGLCNLCRLTRAYVYKVFVKAWLGSIASKVAEQLLKKATVSNVLFRIWFS